MTGAVCYYPPMLDNAFFNRDTITVARALLGKILRVRYGELILSARIIETEAYTKNDKASHGWLGYTEKRKALFMPAGTIYMYYSRGGDSLNISCRGKGNAVLIKSGFPHIDDNTPTEMLKTMRQLNPTKSGDPRPIEKICAGQTLLCKALNLKVPDWDQHSFQPDQFWIDTINYRPKKIIKTTRLGIPEDRDPHFPYRFIDAENMKHCTKPVRGPGVKT